MPVQALVTGGAGFIGSNLVDRLLADGHGVRILDNLSTGYRENIPSGVELYEGSVADEALVRRAVDGVDVVFHQAAHRSVARSVEYPLETDTANVHGTLTVLECARAAGVRRVVYASSSSVYGGAETLPTPESTPVRPRSPYAVTKLTGEHYCRVYAELYGLETVALRYFNVYGPRQRPDSAYAAVIPLFVDALRAGESPTVHGDGGQSRAFTFIDDAVAGNLAAMSAPAEVVSGRVYNLASDGRWSLLDMLSVLGRILDVDPHPTFTAPRAGDIRHSQADITAARRDLAFSPAYGLDEGLERTVAWFVARAQAAAAEA